MSEKSPARQEKNFEGLGYQMGEILAKHASNSGPISLRHFQGETFIYRQGDSAEFMYYILQGRVRSFIYSQDGREKTILILGGGDLLGVAPFYLEGPYLDNAIVFDGSITLYRIDREGFNSLLENEPAAAKILLVDLAARINLLEKEIASQSFLDVRGRLQLALAQLAERYGIVKQDGVLINLHITHEQLAQLIGANRATVSACLSQLQRDGFYQMVGQHIMLAPWAAGKLLLP